MERTYKFKQQELKAHVDLQTQRKIFDLDLDKFGPYRLNYDRNGRYARVFLLVLCWWVGREIFWSLFIPYNAVPWRRDTIIVDHEGLQSMN